MTWLEDTSASSPTDLPLDEKVTMTERGYGEAESQPLLLPWERPPEHLIALRPDGIVAPPTLVVLSRPSAGHDVSQAYLSRIARYLPPAVGDALLESAGAFSFPTTGDNDLDDLIGS